MCHIFITFGRTQNWWCTKSFLIAPHCTIAVFVVREKRDFWVATKIVAVTILLKPSNTVINVI